VTRTDNNIYYSHSVASCPPPSEWIVNIQMPRICNRSDIAYIRPVWYTRYQTGSFLRRT